MTNHKPQRAPVVLLSSDDFLRNVITLSGQVRLTHDDAAIQRSRQQLSGELQYDGDALLVPSVYLTGDLLHSEASEPVLDYATAGVPVLVEWARLLVEENATLRTQLSEHEACVQKRLLNLADKDSSLQLSSDVLRRIVLVPWALDVAFVAARRQPLVTEDKVADARAKEQFFFRRFCHAACGDPHAAILCSHAVRNSTWFASMFGCDELSGRLCY